MSTIKDFNVTLDEFLTDILLIFPNHIGVKKQKLQFEYGRKANVYIAYEKIMPDLMTHSKYILARDENAIPIVDKTLSDTNLIEMWNSDAATDDVKYTIWEYIQTLLTIGTRIYISKNNV